MARTLVTTAVIRGSDQLTPVLSRLSGQVAAFQRQIQTGMSAVGRGAVFGGGSMMAAFGLGGLIRSTREYHDLLFDVKAALAAGDIDDPFAAAKVSTSALNIEVGKLHEKAMKLSRELRQTPEFLAAAANAAARAGAGDDAAAYMRAAGLGKIADRDLDANKAVMDLVTLDILYGNAKANNTSADKLQQERMAKVAKVAALTKTSPSGVFEGMRNVAGISALFGNDLDANLALIGTMVQGGALDKEAGTAIKSLITRLLNPTRMGVSALGRSEIDRSGFMDFSGIDPKRATDQMAQLFAGRYSAKGKGKLFSFLEDAKKTGAVKDVDFAAKVYDFMVRNKVIKADPNTQEDDIAKVAGATQRAGAKLDIFKAAEQFSKAMAEGRLDPGDLGYIGEMRRIHQTGILIKNFELAKKLRAALQVEDGSYLDLLNEAHRTDYAGKLSAIEAAWKRLMVSLVRSDGIQQFVDQLSGLGEVIERANPKVVSMAGWGILAAVAAGPLMALGRGLTIVATFGAAAARWIGAVAASPFGRIASSGRAAAFALAIMGSRFARVAVFGSRLASALAPVARVLGPIGVALGAFQLAQNWEGISNWMQGLANTEGMQSLVSNFSQLRDALSPLGPALSDAAAKMSELFGLNAASGTENLKTFFGLLAGDIAWVLGLATQAVEKLKELWASRAAAPTGKGQEDVPAYDFGITPQRFERSTPFGNEELRDASSGVTIQGGYVETTLREPMRLEGAIDVRVDVRAQGAQAGAEASGMLRGPANAVPVRKTNGSAMGT